MKLQPGWIKKIYWITILLSAALGNPLYALDTTFAGNYIVPELHTGYEAEQYEVGVGKKLQRGLENFFLSPLEVPHGVKVAISERKREYLPAGIETVFLGAFRGIFNGFGRAGIGLYEVFTSPYPQGPIIEEMDEWLY